MENNIAKKYPFLEPIIQHFGNPSQKVMITFGMSFIVIIYLVKSVFLSYYIFWQNKFANDFQIQLSDRLFTTYIKQPYVFHLQRNSANLIRNINIEVVSVYSSLLSVMNFVMEIFVLFSFATLLIDAEPLGSTLIVLIGVIVAFGYSKFTKNKIVKWGEQRVYHLGKSTQHLMQGLSGAKDVKLLGREADFLNQYNHHNKFFSNFNRLYTTFQLLPKIWLEFLAVIALAILVLAIIFQNKDYSIILPTLGLFALAAFRMIPSAIKILNAVQNIRYNEISINIIHEDLKLEVPDIINSTQEISKFDVLEVKLLNYSYPNTSNLALNNISFKIQNGQSIGIVGKSGSGKSTLVDILLGLLTPTKGEIVIDNENIHESLSNLRGWQNGIGYVPQTIYLTDDTLRKNIAFGLPDDKIDENAIIEAIKNAQLEDFINNLPEGLETQSGERGVRLSGGQRQRIGIARALYHNPSVLVLDEATSALDNNTEEAVMECIECLKNKTIIIVAHRLSTVKKCDFIIRLDNGEIIESGVPEIILAT
jgi:ABC-type multidrug transport system fused ATPase/permease subunit